MKIELRVTKDGTSIYTGVHEVFDAESFGKAWADAWLALRQERLGKESSIGALFEHIDDGVLDALNGADISLRKK